MDERIGRAMKLITVLFMSDTCVRDLKEKYPRLLYCNTSAFMVQGIEKKNVDFIAPNLGRQCQAPLRASSSNVGRRKASLGSQRQKC